MPGRTSPLVPPRLVISENVDEDEDTSSYSKLATTRQRAGPSPAVQEQGKPVSEWIDVDETPKRRRRRSRRTTSGNDRRIRNSTTQVERASESELGRFFPRLGRILETTESNISSRSGTRVSDTSRRSDRNSRGMRQREETNSIHRRSPRYRSGGGVQSRTDSLLKINPSLLSVLSGLTNTSDRSSGSNSTITQRSYDRHSSHSSHSTRTTPSKPRTSATHPESSTSSMPRSRSPNVFDYMQAPPVEDGHDDQSVISSNSSATSHYQASDAGSSEAPTTPSSRSTFPSPTTRRGSVAELRRKYDPHYAASSSSRDSIDSTDSSMRGSRKQPSMSDVLEDDDEDQCASSPPTAPSEISMEQVYRRSSRSRSRSDHAEQRLRQQEESMREHVSFAQPSYQQRYNTPDYNQQRAHSLSSSVHSEPAIAHPQHQALQQYQYAYPPILPSPPAVAPHPSSPSALAHQPQSLPHAPDAPDLHKTTLAGYELLASSLASPAVEIKPLYRKFTYLHHRILLHLQDELAEMEAQLRTLDEIIAQAHLSSAPPSPEQQCSPPASRRAESWHGGDLFVQRTSLLGRIFLKQEQYQRALRGYAEVTKEARPANEDEVQQYAAWMAENKPVHAIEAEYLRHRDDLIAPGQQQQQQQQQCTEVVNKSVTRESVKAYWPVAVLVPVLLFALVPDLAGRLVVTALLASGAGLAAGLTNVGGLLTAREWAICGGVYVMVMAGVAGVVPGRT